MHTHIQPKIDPVTGDMILYHMSLVKPYLRVSVLPPSEPVQQQSAPKQASQQLLGVDVPGLTVPKLMHDFGCSSTRTVIIDHPVTLDAMNLLRGKNILDYDPARPARFGIFPRHEPAKAHWIETDDSFVVFHTANTWDDDAAPAASSATATVDQSEKRSGETGSTGLNLLACRLNSATLIYTAGNLQPPPKALPKGTNEPEKCQLYYWRFSSESKENAPLSLETEFALSDVPFEFPTLRTDALMQDASFIYGTSTRNGAFNAKLNLAAKIDCLVKVNVKNLIRKGRKAIEAGTMRKGESVDERTVEQILAQQAARKAAADASGKEEETNGDDISIFAMPSGWYAQEATFVPRANGQSEDDGFLVFYAFDENTGLDTLTNSVWPGATSELWVVDARTMRRVVTRVQLPQRVPYGLHGSFFTEQQIQSQRLPREEDMRSNKRIALPHPRFRLDATAAGEPLSAAATAGKARTLRARYRHAAWAAKDAMERWIG